MSFSNFNSSASGPLLLAFLLALVVLGGFMFLGTLTLDPRYWGGENLEAVIKSNETKIETQKIQEASLRERLQAYDALKSKQTELDELGNIVKQQVDRNTSLATNLVEAKEAIFKIEQEQFEYIQKYRAKVRSEAKGKKMDTLTTTEGVVYKDVTITTVDAIGMGIDHESGGRRIPFKELPLQMQDYYQFGANEAQELAQRESERQKQRDLAHDAAVKSAADRQKMMDAMKNIQDITDQQSALSRARSELYSLESKIFNKKNEIEAQRYQKISQAPQLRVQLENLEATKLKLEAQIRQLSAAQ